MSQKRNNLGKVIRLFIHLVKSNLHKKKQLPYFFSLRHEIRNWFSLYCIYSSFCLDIVEVLGRKLQLNHYLEKLNFKVVFVDGITLYHPITTRFLGFIKRQYEVYGDDYLNLFGEPIQVNEGDIVIDIGAHIGSFAIPLAIKKKAKVLAYEPDPRNFNCIEKGRIANKISVKNFIVHPFAISSTRETVEFVIGDTPSTGSVLSTGFFLQNKTNQVRNVQAITLKDIFEQNHIKHCKLLKIDCEGSEHRIFKDIGEIIEKIEYLFIEVHPVEGFSSEEFIENLRKYFDIKCHKTKTGKGRAYDHMYEVYARKLSVSFKGELV